MTADAPPPQGRRPEPATSDRALQDHMTGTYFGLRAGMAVIGLGLPPALIVGGLLLEPGAGIRPSLSDYYGGGLRDVFVGALAASAALLASYRGFSRYEDRAFDLAAVFAVITALSPVGTSLHGPAAVAFFLCIAYVCLFRAKDTLHLVREPKLRALYRGAYRTLGVLLVVLPAAAAALTILLSASIMVLAVEVAAVAVFGTYWVVKSVEFARTHAELRAAAGDLAVTRPVPPDRAAPPPPAPALARPFRQQAVFAVAAEAEEPEQGGRG